MVLEQGFISQTVGHDPQGGSALAALSQQIPFPSGILEAF